MSRSGDAPERELSRDDETIREWAEEHDAVPVRETTGGDDGGQFRVVPEGDLGESQERLEWNVFFDELEEGDHLVVYHGEEASSPFEVAGREDVLSQVDDEEVERRLLEGETVTTTVTETSVVVEELTVESELIETEALDQRVTDLELLDRECTSCDVYQEGEADLFEQFDAERYLSAAGNGTPGIKLTGGTGAPGGTEPSETSGSETGDVPPEVEESGSGAGGAGAVDGATGEASPGFDDEFPYRAEIEVDETWRVTREFRERYTVESHVVDAEITGTDTIEDHDIDVTGLHRSILESGVIGEVERDRSAADVLSEYDVDSEVAAENRVETTFTRERVVEDEASVRKHLDADVTRGHILEMETLRSDASGPAVPVGGAPGGDAGPAAEAESPPTEPVTLTEDEVGKTVRDAAGEDVGMVTDVEPEANVLYVETTPGITDKVQAALGWGGGDEDDYRLRAEQIGHVTDDAVELKREEHLSGEGRGR